MIIKGNKPILILLPGIMGSTLAKNDDDVWINYGKFLTGGLFDLKIDQDINASGIVKSAYNRIYEKLSEKYDVETFSYDWRKDLTETSALLKTRIENLLAFNQPIKVVAHSMGGVLFRDFIINHDATWQKLNKNRGFKIVHLGTPFRGSMRMASVLMGQDGLIKTLARLDLVHTKNNLLNVFNKFPGLYCLLPLENPEDFAKATLWEGLSDASEYPKPPIPTANELDFYRNYRNKIINKIDTIDYSNMIYVAGKGNRTDESFYLQNNLDQSKTLVFTQTPNGDESVTWEKGIPKQLAASNSVYYAQCVHGELANHPKIFDAIIELLENGATAKLERTPNNLRSSDKKSISTDLSFDLSPRGIEATILGLSDEKFEFVYDNLLEISITKGDLKYAKYPIFSGHFKNDGILYAEKSIDGYLNNILSIRNELGLYPEEIGENALFIPDKCEEKSSFEFNGAIIVGLGKIGELSRPNLSQTIESAALRFLLDLNTNNTNSIEQFIGISSLFIGSGYGGLTIGASGEAIISGIHTANSKIKSYFPTNTIQINHIEFIERTDDKALSAFIQLYKERADLKIVFPEKAIKTSPGNRTRIVLENSDEWWNRITVIERKREKATDLPAMSFSLSSKKASEDKREVHTKTENLENLLKIVSKGKQWNEKIAHTIYEVMIPNDFKENLKNKGHIAWIVDETTAQYPWELLKDQNDKKPLSINSGMVRQLSTEYSTKNVNYIGGEKALVIADPDLEGFVSQLPGALKEGNLVSEIFKNQGLDCKTLSQVKPLEIMMSILPNSCKIIHLAGHGVFDEADPTSSGMIIGNNQFLTSALISQMTNIPDFVFINCCYLGEANANAEIYSQNRYKLAANFGIALIQMGVKAVIAAGWEVNDSSALKFASVFYEAMFGGGNFGDSVLKARKEIYHPSDNTWGAYQCYGDPFYNFKTSSWKNNGKYEFVLHEEAFHELNNINNDLETGKTDTEAILKKLEAIEDAIKTADIRTNQITEMEALIYAELGKYKLACNKYEQLFKSKKAKFSAESIEKYYNVKTKAAVILFENNKSNREKALEEIDNSIENLDLLIKLAKNQERLCLLGSAYKRKGFVLEFDADKIVAYTEAKKKYEEADVIQPGTYPFGNYAPLEVLLNKSEKISKNIIDRNEKYTKNLEKEPTDYKDFWSLVKTNNIRLVELMIDPKNDSKKMIDDFKKLWKFTGANGRKIAELEHLKILIDICKISNKTAHEEKLKEIFEEWVEG